MSIHLYHVYKPVLQLKNGIKTMYVKLRDHVLLGDRGQHPFVKWSLVTNQ